MVLITKTLRVMRLTAIILLACSLHLSASTNSQTISLSGRGISLQKSFEEIRKQTGYYVVYYKDLLKNSRPVNIDVTNIPLADFLEMILKGQSLNYSIKNKNILISRRAAAELSPQLNIEAPPITVRGRILNEKGEPVAASITVKGTARGVVTDNYGNFELNNVDDNSILFISGITIETQTIKLNGQNILNITAVTKVTSEEEVTVSTGYWNAAKRNSVMSIAKVDAKDIEKQPVMSPLLALQGRMAGVDITPSSGAPGATVNIQIRGQNNFRVGGNTGALGNLPLYVIDGIPVDSRPLASGSSSLYPNGGFDPLSALNPANIDNIQILKDAAATAIYGSRGANGVVLITTKKGAKNKEGDIDVSAYSGIGAITGKLDLLNRRQYLDLRYEAFRNDGIDLATAPLTYQLADLKFWDTTRATDWQKELLGETSKINDAQVNFSGGNNRTTFRIGAGYHKETSPINNDFNSQRWSGNFSLNHTSSDNRFRAGTSLSYGVTKNRQFDDANYISTISTIPPVAPPLYDDAGNLNWAITTIQGSDRNTWVNPLSVLLQTHDAEIRQIIANTNVSYAIFDGLEIKLNAGITQTNGNELVKNPIKAKSPTSITPTSTARAVFGNNDRATYTVEPQLNYTKRLNKHNIDILIGTAWQNSEYNYTSINATQYTSDAFLNSTDGAGQVKVITDNSQYRYTAFYGRIGYSFNQKYYLDASGRRDGSSRFGPGKQFGNFGAVGAGWIFSEESFMQKHLHWISFGKLRASYGITGNDQIGDYQYLNTYSAQLFPYQGAVAIYPTSLYNPDFAWESSKKMEIGIELGLLDNRITGEFSWYRTRTSNQLVNYQLPYTTGFQSIFTNFDATVQNTGWEFAVNAQVIKSKDFKWNINLNYTIPRNKLVAFPGIETSPYANLFKVGEPLGITGMYSFKGLDVQTGKYQFEDVDQSGNYTPTDMVLKNINRVGFGGLNNLLSYKNIEFSFFFQYSNSFSQFLPSSGIPGGNTNQFTEVLNHWQKPGDISKYGMVSQTPQSTALWDIYRASDAFLNKSIFVRLKTVYLAYRFKNFLGKGISSRDLNVFISGFNLLTFWDSNGTSFDPETKLGLPPLKTVNIGFQLKL